MASTLKLNPLLDPSEIPHPLIPTLTHTISWVLEAGELAKDILDNHLSIRHKGGDPGNPVTEVDEALSQFLMKKIHGLYPEDAIVSEEEPLPQNIADLPKRIWFIDPVDGTKEMIANIPEWSIMVGLVERGRPILGVVYQPVLQELYYAVANGGAYFSNTTSLSRLSVRKISDISEAVLFQSRSHWSQSAQDFAEKLGISKSIKQGSIGLKLGMIARGTADLYLNLSGRCHLWDVCAPEIILQEAGGRVLTATGDTLNYQSDNMVIKESFLASNSVLAKKLYTTHHQLVFRKV